jgi:hypothetical protein
VTINAEDDPSFSYGQASYCQDDPDPTAVISGTSGGTFSGPPEIVFIDSSTGEIDLSASTAGGPYTITYLTPVPDCPNSATWDLTIVLSPTPPPFASSPIAGCVGGSPPALTATGTSLLWYSDPGLTDLVGVGTSFTPQAGIIDMSVQGTTSFFVTQNTGCGPSIASIVDVEVDSCAIICSDYVVSVIPINTTCETTSDGAIFMLVSNGIGGTNQYSLDSGMTYFNFDGPISTQTQDTLSTGKYTVLVKATGTGCPADTSIVTVGTQVLLIASADVTNPTCGAVNGMIKINISGGSQPYSIQLTNSAGQLISPGIPGEYSGLPVGKYHYQIGESGGCSYIPPDSVILSGSSVSIAVAGTDQNICADSTTLNANLPGPGESGLWTVISGNGTLEDPGLPGSKITGMDSGDNIIKWTITDSTGICISESTVIITSGNCAFDCNMFDVSPVAGNVSCQGGDNGSVLLLIPAGASGNYEYYMGADTVQFSGNQVMIGQLTSGVYDITVVDIDNLCFDSLNDISIGYYGKYCKDRSFMQQERWFSSNCGPERIWLLSLFPDLSC